MDKEKTQESTLDEFQGWSSRHERQVNTNVIENFLPAHVGQRRRRPVWRQGEVAAAMDRAVDTAPVAFLVAAETVEDTLDAWFRFLRNTGKLGAGSADPRRLRREARRAARAAVDRAFALARQLLDEWDEPENPWDDPNDPRYENVRVLRDLGIDRWDVLARSWGSLPDAERAADLGWSSGYMSRLRAVAQAISPAVELEGYLFPSLETAKGIVASCPAGTFDGEVSRPAARAAGRVLSGAFINVWFDADTAGFIELRDGRAAPGPAYFGQEWESAIRRLLPAVGVGQRRFDDLMEELEFGAGLICLVVRSLRSRCGWVALQDVTTGTPWPWYIRRSEIDTAHLLGELRNALRCLEELAVVEVDGEQDRMRLTCFGVWVVDGWLSRQFDVDGW
jgi:hypothetical protein